MTPPPRTRLRRRKVTLACEPCRYRKSRCDGGKPICSTCQRRGLALEQCIYSTENARTACKDDYTKSLHERIRELEQACSSQQTTTPSALLDSCMQPQGQVQSENVPIPQTETSSPAISLGSELGQCQSGTSTTSHTQIESSKSTSGVTAMGTMLSEDVLHGSFTGNREFYGGSSAISFINEAYGPMGSNPTKEPSSDPDNRTSSTLLAFSNLANFPLPPRPLADHLVQRYFDRVYYLYPFFDREAFESGYRYLWQPGTEPETANNEYRGLGLGSPLGGPNTGVFHCALNAIFALGCTFSDLEHSEKPAAIELFFNRAKMHIGLDLLDTNNISVVQSLLLVALVLQGTAFPNRCWNAVGVACRVAQGLGLHTDINHKWWGVREKEVRRRTWHGCVVMDMLVSMIFGRPNMTSNLSILPFAHVDDGATESESERLKFQFSIESIRLSKILEGILSKVYQTWQSQASGSGELSSSVTRPPPSLDSIMELNTQLDAFESSLPNFLSWKNPALENTIPEEVKIILSIQRNVLHGRFLYLQLMLYRPIFTHLLINDNTIDNGFRAVHVAQVGESTNALMSSFELQCARSCVSAAINLIKLIYNTHTSNASDAWWWNGLYACTSGLVLISARLSKPLWESLSETDVSESWKQCQAVLQSLALVSPSGRKSIEIILKLHDIVIAKQASKDVGSDNLPHPPMESQETIQSTFPDLPRDFADHNFPLNFGDLESEPMLMGSFLPCWDPTLEFMSAEFE